MADSDRLFKGGSLNTGYGRSLWIGSVAGNDPEPERIQIAARMLDREPFFKDRVGCEHEIFAAAISNSGRIAYVESRTKDAGPNSHGFRGRLIDVSISVHLIDSHGNDLHVDIKCYNPISGCAVRYFEWIGEIVVLIYREKHRTYASRFGDVWPPSFLPIEDDWLIYEDQLTFIGYKEDAVRRLTFPRLEPLEPLTINVATNLNLMPKTHWA